MSSAEAIGRERRIGYSMALKLDQMRCSRWMMVATRFVARRCLRWVFFARTPPYTFSIIPTTIII